MSFLIIPAEGFTDYLIQRAHTFGGPKVATNILSDDNFKSPTLKAIFVIQSDRRSAEAINQQRVALNLPELFIIEVPYPSVKKRVVRHPVRARIAQILENNSAPLYGYAIYKLYTEKFGPISIRLVYYHLTRGVKERLFVVKQVEEIRGDYSWGNQSMRKYYDLNRA